MGKFPSEGRIAPRGAFKRFMRGLRAKGVWQPHETREDFRRG